MRKPYYLESRKGWYLKVPNASGSLSAVRIGDTKREAYDFWREVTPAEKTTSLASVVDSFLTWADRQVVNGAVSKSTVANYRWYLLRLIVVLPDAKTDALKPHEIADWIASEKGWGPSAERAAITSVKRCLNWAMDQQLIAVNPLARMKRPASRRRSVLVGDAGHAAMIAKIRDGSKIDRRFSLAMIALKHTGGRPQDVARATIEANDGETWVIEEHKTRRKTDKPRIVYLSPCLQTVTKLAAGNRTSGPLFVGRGGGLTVNAIVCRIKRLRESLGLPAGTVAYSYRHTFITSALVRGVPIATVAELTGTSVTMIERHYGHLSKNADHLKKAAGDVFRR